MTTKKKTPNKKTVPKKKAGKKGPAKTTAPKGKSLMQNTTKIFISLSVFLLLLMTILIFVTRISIPDLKVNSTLTKSEVSRVEPTKPPVYKETSTPIPVIVHREEKKDNVTYSPKDAAVKAAIIIDDLGQDIEIARKLISLKIPLAIAVLPDMTYSRQIAKLAHEKGKVVMAHLPMQAIRRDNMTAGLPWLETSMSRVKIEEILEAIFAQNPYASGANNHTGSLFTANSQSMGYVLDYLKKHHLFFVDSRTTTRTVAFTEARERAIPSCERNVFFDDDHNPEIIRKEFKRFIEYAKIHGTAVGIGHPRPETFMVLKEFIPKFHQENIRIVKITDLLKPDSEELKLARTSN